MNHVNNTPTAINVSSRIDNGKKADTGPRRTGFLVNVVCCKSSKVLLSLLLDEPEGGWLPERHSPYRGSIIWVVGSEDLEVRSTARALYSTLLYPP